MALFVRSRSPTLAADIIARLWENWGLEPQPWGGMFRYLYLDICPPTLQVPRGTGQGALAHGLPLLVARQGADQFLNADRCVAAGVARRLLPFDLQPNSVRSNVGILLEEPEYQEHSRRLQEETEQMPGPEKGVELLERLARERKPLTRAGLV